MTIVGDLLDQIELELRRLDAPVLGLLLPALTDAALPHLGLPRDVELFTTWRGGTLRTSGSLTGEAYFIPGYYYPSVDVSRDYKLSYGELGIGSDWMPLLLSDGGDCYAAFWEESTSAAVAEVLIGDGVEIEYPSIQDFLEDCLARFRSGAFYIAADGMLDMLD
jgi:hypothetical protein